ncbi:MAG: hypothetical protein MJ152_04665, partial [Clostridia bacterium]|nr:hypothetical protein [Clostridia bacterium]
LTYTIDFISLKTPVQKQISMLVLSSLSKTTDTGLSLTTKIVDGYNDKVGSQLKVEKTSADDCNYDKYVIYGNNYNESTGDSYTIYAAKNSTLYFDVDDASVNYLTCDTSTRPMALTGGTSTIDFVHLAKAYKATIKFYVQRNDSFYITKAGAKDSLEFGTNVAKTYGGLKVEYVGTDAQSELVASNSTTYDETTTTGVTIFDYFFKEDDPVEDAVKNKATHPARIALLNTSGEVVDIGKSNLKEMGFETINNPNYINYYYGEAVSPKLVNNKVYLQFASVSETYKSTHIDLKNNAGVDVTYNFYVTNLAQGKEQANGYYQETAPKVKYGENYTTILVDDNDPIEEHDFGSQNILSIYDTNNLGFYVTGLSLELDKRGTIDKGTVITRE